MHWLKSSGMNIIFFLIDKEENILQRGAKRACEHMINEFNTR